MEQHERLELYEKALKDWSKPHKMYDDTGKGFCYYFLWAHNVNTYKTFRAVLPELYAQRRTEDRDIRHYTENGYMTEGRKQRVKALKAAIKLCK